jgi:hypothetical protein
LYVLIGHLHWAEEYLGIFSGPAKVLIFKLNKASNSIFYTLEEEVSEALLISEEMLEDRRERTLT